MFEAAASEPEKLIVPVVTVYEVVKYLRRVKGADLAMRAALYMQRGKVIDIGSDIALAAVGNSLPMADSLIYATAQAHGAVVWTQDAHFDGLAGVRYFPKS